MRVKQIGILDEKYFKNKELLKTLTQTGNQCFCTDLARLTEVPFEQATGFGSYWFNGEYVFTKKNKNITNKTRTITNNMNYIDYKGSLSSTSRSDFKSGVRIAFSFDDIEDFDLSKLDNLCLEYPLTVIGGRVGETFDKLFESKSKLIATTGRVHFIDDKEYREYEAFGIRFIRKRCKVQQKLLSDGTLSKKDEDVYLRVEEIPLTIDEEERLVYSSVILFGAEFDSNGNKFEDSDLHRYLNDGFLKSINDEFEHSPRTLLFNDDSAKDECNRYGFNFNSLTEEDIIEICINSNVAVFLHGKTGVGKTERMIALDRNLELVDFGCTSPDGFTGIIAKDFNSKELFLYEPYWYKSFCAKCEAEPDKIHILFLEELTNARSDVQKVAFEVSLNKTLTNSGFRLKLPENAVVCAAGNEANESKSATALSEPLFGRFAHVYIETDSEEWLKWALKRKKDGRQLLYQKHEDSNTIHPAIIDYIRVNGDKVLRTEYNGVTPNADPRKWALASKALYQSNNPNVLRAFIGEELTHDFIKFCQMRLITIDDVLNDRYRVEDVDLDSSLRWYTTVCLSTVDDENVDKVREFVSGLGKEFLAVFDYEWSKDNDERIMKLYNQTEKKLVKRLELNGNK